MTISLPERIPLDAIRQARQRIKDSAVRTPLVRLPYDGPREIWLKLEMLQPVGSFKIRGARNAIAALDDEQLKRGIYTASAGNMAQGLAWCARERNIAFTAIVPASPSHSTFITRVRSPVSQSLPASGGKSGGVPCPSIWWHIRHFSV